MLSRPTVGRSRSNSTRAIALPMTARSTRWSASAPIVAPTSSTTESPLSVGHSAAIAGRSIPGMVRRLNFAIAIRAPVLPAETATSASPFFTASIASHIDDFQRPWRSAWLGLASIFTTTSVCTSREAALSRGRCSSNGATTASSPNRTNSVSGMAGKGKVGPGNHDRRPDIAPHGIERNSDLLGHSLFGAAFCFLSAFCRAPGNSGSRAARPTGSAGAEGHYSSTVPFFFIRPAPRTAWRRGSAAHRRRERCVRFARIRVDAENQELGRQGSPDRWCSRPAARVHR